MKTLTLLALVAALRLQVTPHTAIAPQDLHVRVFLDRDADNRWLEVRASSPDFDRSTGFSLEGELSPGVFDWWWVALPCGTYAIQARVTRQDGSSRTVRDTAHYLGAACQEIE